MNCEVTNFLSDYGKIESHKQNLKIMKTHKMKKPCANNY
jgi:hypothetical protein